MMRPPCGSWLFIMRKACWAQRNEPVKLTATTSDHCSKVRSSNGMPRVLIPALLNNKSMRPYVSLTRSKRAVTAAGSRTSVGTTRVRGGGASARAAVSSSISRRRPASTADQPSASRACAVARPMPLPAPVMTAIFAAVSMWRCLLLLPISHTNKRFRSVGRKSAAHSAIARSRNRHRRVSRKSAECAVAFPPYVPRTCEKCRLEPPHGHRSARRDELVLGGNERQFAAAGAHRRLDHRVDRGDRRRERVGHRFALEQPAQEECGHGIAATGRFDRQARRLDRP